MLRNNMRSYLVESSEKLRTFFLSSLRKYLYGAKLRLQVEKDRVRGFPHEQNGLGR